MAADPITFGDAERIVEEHWQRFNRNEVDGVGVAERNGRLCFVVNVKRDQDKQRVAKAINIREVEGLPVHFECQELVYADSDGDDDVCSLPIGFRREAMNWLRDRPGYAVVGVAATILMASAATVFWGLSWQ